MQYLRMLKRGEVKRESDGRGWRAGNVQSDARSAQAFRAAEAHRKTHSSFLSAFKFFFPVTRSSSNLPCHSCSFLASSAHSFIRSTQYAT